MTTAVAITTVKARLVDVAAAVLDGWQVAYSWPGQAMLRECFYLGDVRPFGDGDAPEAITGPRARKPSKFNFEIDAWIVCAQIGQTCQQAEERAEVAYNALKSALVDPTVAGPDLQGAGNTPATYSAITGLDWVWLRPGELLSDPDKDAGGWVTTFRLTFEVHTRLT